MEDTTLVDARGLSCPEPAMMAKKAVKEKRSGRIEMLVDADPLDNCRRVAEMAGWHVEVQELPGSEFRLVFIR